MGMDPLRGVSREGLISRFREIIRGGCVISFLLRNFVLGRGAECRVDEHSRASCIVHRLDTPSPPRIRANHLYFYPPSPLFSSDSQLQQFSFSINFNGFLRFKLEDELLRRSCIGNSLLSIYFKYVSLLRRQWDRRFPKQAFSQIFEESSGLRNAGPPFFPRPGQRDYTHSEISDGPSFSLRRSMDRGLSAGFPFLAGRRRGESLVPARSLSFTFHTRGGNRLTRGGRGEREQPAARHGCTTKLARRVPVLSVSILLRAWDDSTILYLAPTDPFPSLDGARALIDRMQLRSWILRFRRDQVSCLGWIFDRSNVILPKFLFKLGSKKKERKRCFDIFVLQRGTFSIY